MTTVLVESFDLYSNNVSATDGTGVLSNWSCAYPYDSAIIAGRYAGQALRKPQAGGIEPWYRTLATPLTTFTFAHDWRNQNLGVEMVHMMRDTGTDQLTPVANSDGSISIHLGNASGPVLGTSPPAILVANSWYFMEYAVVLDASAGSIEVWAEGLPILSLSNINTLNASGGFGVIQVPESGVTDVDNMVVQDVINRTGPLRSDPYFPASDVSTGTFVASSGTTLYNMVSENPMDGDTSYIESPNAGDVALFTPQPLTGTDEIFGVCVTCVAETANGSGRAMQIEFTDGTNTTEGPTITLTGSYASTQSFFPAAPDGTPWTSTSFNAVEAGVKVVS